MSGADRTPLRLRRLANRPHARLRRPTEDPLSGVANLADLMLVFATGLVVALVLAWDMARALDPSLGERLRRQEMLRSAREVESLQRAGSAAAADEMQRGTGRYRSVGQVYQDTATGRMFVVEEEK